MFKYAHQVIVGDNGFFLGCEFRAVRLNKAPALYPASPIFAQAPRWRSRRSKSLCFWTHNQSQVKPSLRPLHFQIRDNNVILPSSPSTSAKLCHNLRPPQRHLDTPKSLVYHSHIILCPSHRPLIVIPNTASLSSHSYRE